MDRGAAKRKKNSAQIEYIEVEDQNVCKRSKKGTQNATPFYESLKTDKDIFVWTGIPNNKMLKCIEHCVGGKLKKRMPHIIGFDITIRGLIILVLVRLKVNLSFDQMAILFKMRPIHLAKYFSEFLPMLKMATEDVILTTVSTKYKQITHRNSTKFYQENCTDIEINKPKVLAIGKTDANSKYKG